MKIVCIGGSPTGLYFGLLMKKLNVGHRVTAVERNMPDDTVGCRVLFSDATLEKKRACRTFVAKQRPVFSGN